MRNRRRAIVKQNVKRNVHPKVSIITTADLVVAKEVVVAKKLAEDTVHAEDLPAVEELKEDIVHVIVENEFADQIPEIATEEPSIKLSQATLDVIEGIFKPKDESELSDIIEPKIMNMGDDFSVDDIANEKPYSFTARPVLPMKPRGYMGLTEETEEPTMETITEPSPVEEEEAVEVEVAVTEKKSKLTKKEKREKKEKKEKSQETDL